MKNHYTYRITNTKLKKHYYGVRSTEKIPSKDLGFKYFSSSMDSEFMEDQKKNPHLYKYKIVSIFKTRIEAIILEIKLHERFDVAINTNFYNKAKATHKSFDCSGTKRTDKSKLKMSNSRIGKDPWNKGLTKCYDDETLNNMSIAKTGTTPINKGKKGLWKPNKEQLDKLSESMKGRKLSKEHITNLSKKRGPQPNMKKPKAKVTCIHCLKEGGVGSMGRWHFDNCKKKPNELV
jgi:hypothetical protein